MKYIILVMISVIFSCTAPTSVQRVNSDTQKDLSGYWNDTDSKMVSDEMVQNLQNANWLVEYLNKKSKKPVIILGKVKNKTSEHINTETFTRDIEKYLVNGGKIRFVSSTKDRDQIRQERLDQASNSNLDQTKDLANETAADYMLTGDISSIVDEISGEKIVYYQVNLELVDIETNEKVWINDKKIKKFISKSSYKFR